MAGNAISIDILANVRDALKGTGDVEKALSDIESTLEDMAQSGDKSVDKMSRGFRDLAKDADKSAEKVEDSYKAAFRGVSKASRDATDDVDKFGANARDELKDSAREGAQSFSGEFTDIQDVLQETVANLGPAGIAGAAIIGAIAAVATQSVEAWNEKIDGIKDATAEMWQEAAADGQRFIDESAIQAEAHRILWDKAYEADLKAAQDAGVSRSDFAIALAEGEGEVFDRVHQAFMDAKDAESEKAKETAVNIQNAGLDGFHTETQAAAGIKRTIDVLDEKARAVEENQQKAQDAAAVTAQLHEQERSQIQRTRDADQARYEALAARASQGVTIPVKADTTDIDRQIQRLRNTTLRIAGKFTTVNGQLIQ